MEKLLNNISNEVTPHVVIFPLPIQGPVNCMLKLAELILSLSRGTISVTFINSEFIQHLLDLYSPAPARLSRFGSFGFETVSDGLGPYENPRGGQQLADITNYLGDQARATGSRLRELLVYGSAGPRRKPVTCIIADGLFWFMPDVAKEIGVPLVYFETVSPCGLWTYLCVPKMLQAGDLPFPGDDMDALVTSVPGMETYLRRRDLPSFYRDYDPNNQVIQLFLKEAQYYSSAQGHILNTFDDLEGEWRFDKRMYLTEAPPKNLMGTGKEEFLKKVDCMAKLAVQAVGPSGSSYNQLNRLIDDIKFKRFAIPSNAH